MACRGQSESLGHATKRERSEEKPDFTKWSRLHQVHRRFRLVVWRPFAAAATLPLFQGQKRRSYATANRPPHNREFSPATRSRNYTKVQDTLDRTKRNETKAMRLKVQDCQWRYSYADSNPLAKFGAQLLEENGNAQSEGRPKRSATLFAGHQPALSAVSENSEAHV